MLLLSTNNGVIMAKSSKNDKVSDKKLGYKEGSKKDNAIDKKIPAKPIKRK